MADTGSDAVDDQLNVPLVDAELLEEVELTTNLIIAASEADAMLPQAVVDDLLGLTGGTVVELNPPIPYQQARRGA
jgi:hypothetical protein